MPKTPLFGAIAYALKRWEELNRFLDHPHATSSNNRAENAIRPFVLARKGFLFANTPPQGAKASALTSL
ncbi:MAG: IS66 family transposase [Sphaerochaetaceae bacterium]